MLKYDLTPHDTDTNITCEKQLQCYFTQIYTWLGLGSTLFQS